MTRAHPNTFPHDCTYQGPGPIYLHASVFIAALDFELDFAPCAPHRNREPMRQRHDRRRRHNTTQHNTTRYEHGPLTTVMYRRSDPRWNRTLQHLSENLEHANESAQENLYGFTQRYVNPCLASMTHCVQTCTAPCLPRHNDRRRRHRGRSRGRAESSFDFYDDWDDEESDGLLGWGSDSLDRFLASAGSYGSYPNYPNYGATTTTTTQPTRQPAMGYCARSRDPRYSTPRRKSTALQREAGQDPTIIPSSSYFGFLGRLPWRIRAKGLRYKPSAADLTDHPGAMRSARGEDQPLLEAIDDEDEDEGADEAKRHRRQRSDTRTSGHTTDSLSSRGDIFPSEDELEDAVPLDDEFTIALERRTTGQWNEASSSTSKRPSVSQVSTPQAIEQAHTLPTIEQQQEDVQLGEDADIRGKHQSAQQPAHGRGLTPEQTPREQTPSSKPRTAETSSPHPQFQMTTVDSTVYPLLPSPTGNMATPADVDRVPSIVDAQTMPESSSFYVDESDYSSMVPTPVRPSSINEPDQSNMPASANDQDFVPARLPFFGAG
ncbi:hypothetical protein LEMA_P063970.1 [Plenodomus lingam JN3]|uniref:Uncharacterized protein n=1 Tax=Leptosphaeria maculans (strain JN3 / isolate v23.1.3 / race Av1-4-5-6-7-8) TaxID=985895 RepID=E4ZG51_LEPMJ|nr:hypothetical protein LEMA_P063970.1 [Plenodomus lingam JN3]CBX90271.1 hypothetical protein LEMA_P063970.1 [Plenodomus lingam JN3]